MLKFKYLLVIHLKKNRSLLVKSVAFFLKSHNWKGGWGDDTKREEKTFSFKEQKACQMSVYLCCRQPAVVGDHLRKEKMYNTHYVQ